MDNQKTEDWGAEVELGSEATHKIVQRTLLANRSIIVGEPECAGMRVVTVVSGEAGVIIDGNRHEQLTAGDAFTLGAGKSYRLDAPEQSQVVAVDVLIGSDAAACGVVRQVSRESSGRAVVQIKSVGDAEEFLRRTSKRALKITASWCPPCKSIAPIYESVAQANSSEITAAEIDVDEMPEIVEDLGVTAMPTFVFFDCSGEIGRFEGADEEKLRKNVSHLRERA